VDRIESLKVVCSGGLNSNENHLDLAENNSGAATRLLNYEPSLFGGYRRIEGFNYYDTTVTYASGDYGQEVQAKDSNNDDVAEGPILGLVMYRNENSTSNPYPIAMRKDVGANTYSFWKHQPLLGWNKITTGLTDRATQTGSGFSLKTVSKVRHVQFNFGTRAASSPDPAVPGSFIIFVDGVNPAVIFDGTNWREITSSGAGTLTSPGGATAYDAPAIVDVFENHIFMGGDLDYRGGISHCAPLNPFDWTTASGGEQYSIGYEVVQIKPFRDNLFVFGQNAIKKFTADASTSAPAPFKLDSVTANTGCVARDSVQELGGDLIFLAHDGLRPVAGTSRIGDVELESISRPIQGRLIDIIKNEDLGTLNSCVIKSKSQVRVFIGGTADEGIGILGGLVFDGSAVKWEYSELLGFKVSCITSEFIGAREYVLHGGFDGKVYQQENGNTLAGEDIISIYSTPYLDMGDTEIRKTIHKLNTFVRAEGPFTMNLALQYDWSDPNTINPADYAQTSTGAPVVFGGRNITYGGSNVTYGGTSKPVILNDIQGSGFSVQATFVTQGQFAPHTIQGMVFEYAKAGRR